MHELPAQELAEELGTMTARVHNGKYRVLKRLKEEFGELLED